jgi:hypothetical protein
MKRYPALRQNSGQAWKRRENQRKWRDILAIFIAGVLIFAIINGFFKTFSLKKFVSQSEWDSKSSFVSFLDTINPSIFVFQTDPKRMVFLELDGERYLQTGKQNQPLAKLSTLISEKSGVELSKMLSLSFGADIEKYVFFSKEQSLNSQSLRTMFKNFASPLTPLLILTGRRNNDIKDTNLTRIDMIKLWWQLKDLSTDKLELVDLSPLSEEVVTSENQKVLGVDETSLHFQISKYLENPKIASTDFKVVIQNASGMQTASSLASDFMTSVGFDISKTEVGENIADKTKILAKKENSYPAGYLARIFNCDIVGSQNAGEDTAIVILGRDFADKYFQ